MVKSWKTPQSTIDNANLVWEYAECSKDEAKHEKQKILANFDELDESYRLMADKIRREK